MVQINRYDKSEKQLIRAEKTIPLGSQTFSKSRTQYPVGISPLYISRAKGAHVWDLDGNKYIDLVNSLASVSLGYGDKDVSRAVRKQLKKGVSFSLPGILESEVAELLVDLIPSAEMVRFGKNGSDATSAAIRLARAYTGRDHIVVCGYHGWQDWYIGSTTRNKGVPNQVSGLTHKFIFNDIDSLKDLISDYHGKIAAVILEPMNSVWPEKGFLESVKKLTSDEGALLIFDETITGFRFSRGGAQELFGVIPDLSTFGKGMANGFPLSAVVGRRDVMMEMEEIFFSGTFGGELLSLAASKVVLEKHQNQDLCANMGKLGDLLATQLELLIDDLDLSSILKLSGHPTWKFLNWSATEDFDVAQIRTYFQQEMYKMGILIIATHNISLAMDEQIVLKVLKSYEFVLNQMKNAIEVGDLKSRLLVAPLQPLFKVR
jgi:glutamate-1-semialdehyde 2,1-aminomutase